MKLNECVGCKAEPQSEWTEYGEFRVECPNHNGDCNCYIRISGTLRGKTEAAWNMANPSRLKIKIKKDNGSDL